MKKLILIVIAIALVGCNTKPRYFHTGTMIAKHPQPIEAQLTLLPEQRYKLVLYVEASDSYETERGRWWELEERVLLLHPDDPDKKQRFAHAREGPISLDFRTLWLFNDLRPAMEEPQRATDLILEVPRVDEPESEEKDPGLPAIRLSDDLEAKLAEFDASDSEKRRLRIVLYKTENPYEITDQEYDSLTEHPYSREPFLKDDVLSAVYFQSFCRGYAVTVQDPGGIRLYLGKRTTPHSLWDAADVAGFHAGHSRQTSPLTNAEMNEVERWKQSYRDAIFWPYTREFE